MMRTHRTMATTLAAVALAGAAGAGVAQAAPATAGSAAPSACRPANHIAKVAQVPGNTGHLHYRVTLTAPRGYESCELAGSPTDVRFSHHGSQVAATTDAYGDQKTVVTFGPGHPVHYDILVRGSSRATPADEVSFTLQAPDGEIPGTSFAEGSLKVADGTLIGPIAPGA
ncbi:hypothetical protein A6A06_37645 [Streptomyces sp. CB02923]|uniref:hypothetical protein n=1 Tax=Streptomyces sp. CB02923 TaxID=1718985 RepID=UPI00093B8513|nr:hypothetical protein [Streptomyces sp. CB02923]OKI06226.1 hypothetical protein A6A06_37645 [Streptomyces sp. CB02923]